MPIQRRGAKLADIRHFLTSLTSPRDVIDGRGEQEAFRILASQTVEDLREATDGVSQCALFLF